jgi:type II secretory pathway component PulF
MAEDTLAKIAAGAIALGVWLGMLWYYVAMGRRTTLRELLTLRLRACVRLQLPLLRALKNSAGAPREVARVMREAAEKMEKGQMLSEALREQPGTLPRWYTRTVALGESTGNLAEVFDLLLETEERGQERRVRYFNQLLYPFMLLLSVGTMLEGILLFILPSLRDMFQEMGVEESALQSALLAIADVVVPIAPLILIVLALLMLSVAPFPWGMAWGGLFPLVDWLRKLGRRIVPGLGKIYFRAASARWAGAVSLLLEAGMPLPEALGTAAGVETDPTFSRAADRWTEGVASGKSLVSVLSETRFVPRTLLWQVRCAEGGPDLATLLRDAGEREIALLHEQVGYVFGLVSPLLILAIGGLVALVAVGLFQYMTRLLYVLL